MSLLITCFKIPPSGGKPDVRYLLEYDPVRMRFGIAVDSIHTLFGGMDDGITIEVFHCEPDKENTFLP